MASGTVYVKEIPFNYQVKGGVATVTYLSLKEAKKEPEKQKPTEIIFQLVVAGLSGAVMRDVICAKILSSNKAKELIAEHNSEEEKK